jgi:hypothetical protein
MITMNDKIQNPSFWTERPWQVDFSGIDGIPAGMLGPREASLLFYIARDYYGGFGDIVDAGAFLGASSYSLAKGVNENESIKSKSGFIHAYDLFQVWPEPGFTEQDMSRFLERTYGIETSANESTLHIYTANLGSLARHVRVHQGDFLLARWSGRPIEILFVDICKTPSLLSHVIREFFGSLIPRISLVIHQDWHHPALPYIHVAQEYLGDYFDVVEAKADDSAVFKLIERIPDNMLDTAARYAFSPDEEVALLDRAINRFQGSSRFLKLSKAELLRRQGKLHDAMKIVEITYAEHNETMSEEGYAYFASNVDGVAMAISRDLARIGEKPEGFVDASYLEANPDAADGIREGRLESALHHWHRFGRIWNRPLRK